MPLSGALEDAAEDGSSRAAKARTEEECCGCSTSLECASMAQATTRPSLVAEKMWSSFQGLQHTHVTCKAHELHRVFGTKNCGYVGEKTRGWGCTPCFECSSTDSDSCKRILGGPSAKSARCSHRKQLPGAGSLHHRSASKQDGDGRKVNSCRREMRVKLRLQYEARIC
jgi:hypothetical protein